MNERSFLTGRPSVSFGIALLLLVKHYPWRDIKMERHPFLLSGLILFNYYATWGYLWNWEFSFQLIEQMHILSIVKFVLLNILLLNWRSKCIDFCWILNFNQNWLQTFVLASTKLMKLWPLVVLFFYNLSIMA